MNFRRLILITTALAAAVISCKKDDETESLPVLQGTMQILDLPEFVVPGQVCTLKVKGAVHPEDKGLGYYWKVNPGMSSSDTTRFENGLDRYGKESDGTFVHKFPTASDSLLTYTVTCYAFASGYSGNSTSIKTTLVKSGKDGSVRGEGYPSETGTSTIGSQTWTSSNLTAGEGMPFRNAEVMADIFGRYYSFDQAEAACEALGSDWKLPTLEDWDIMEKYIGSDPEAGKSTAAALMLKDATFNGAAMWEYWPKVGEITNAYGFSAIPTGYANISSGTFDGSFEYSVFWTADSVEGDDSLAYCKYLISNQPDLFTDKADKSSFGASVRCIRK